MPRSRPVTQEQFDELRELLLAIKRENEVRHNEIKADIKILQDNVKLIGIHYGLKADIKGRLKQS